MPSKRRIQVLVRFDLDEWAQIAAHQKSTESNAALVKRRALTSAPTTAAPNGAEILTRAQANQWLDEIKESVGRRIQRMESSRADAHAETVTEIRRELKRFLVGFDTYMRAIRDGQIGAQRRAGNPPS